MDVINTVYARMGRFITVPKSVFNILPELGSSAFIVFVCLQSHADKNGRCWPSYDRIEEETGLSRSVVANSINILYMNGLIEKCKKFDGPTTYYVKYPVITGDLFARDRDEYLRDMEEDE